MNGEEKPIDSPRDIPAGLSDEERMAFLEEHGVSEYFLENVEEASEEERPRPRTKPVNIRFDDFTLRRLKGLAERRNVGYQTLLKEFVTERLYEEERRQGVLPVGHAPEAESGEERKAAKPRDWQQWAYDLREGKQRVTRRPGHRLDHPVTTGEERVHPVVGAESRDQKGQCQGGLPGRTAAADAEGPR